MAVDCPATVTKIPPAFHFVSQAFQLVTFVFYGLMLLHVWKYSNELKEQDGAWKDGDEANRGRWLSTLLWGAVFGYVVESALSAGNQYFYPKHPGVIMLTNLQDSDKPVPLWVALGWGILIYATTWTAQRFKQGRVTRAMFAALLAVGIDLSLDPVARFFHMWEGKDCPPYFYTVPFDNFTGWLLIIFTFAFAVRLLFKKLGSLPGSVIWVPFLASVVSLKVVEKVDGLLQKIYPSIPGGDLTVFFLLSGLALFVVVYRSRRLKCDFAPSWLILSVPIAFHSLSWIMLLVVGECLSSEHAERPTLLVLIPLALGVGFVSFAWASIDKLFPRSGGEPEVAGRDRAVGVASR